MELVEWLTATMIDAGPGTRGQAEVAEVLDRLAEVNGLLSGMPGLVQHLVGAGQGAPLVLANSVVQALNACEGLAVATARVDEKETSWAMFRGRALDAYVAHTLLSGPVADPVGDLCSMWTATEDHEALELLETFAADAHNTADLTRLADAASFFGGGDRWVPRAEVTMGSYFVPAFSMRGRVDVVFGGPGTGMPTVLVEVKSSRLRDSHYAQIRHYVMLAGLRHGELPAAAALWSPDTGLVPIPVPGSARSATERVAVAARRLGELRSGREPELSPGVHCRFCPVAGSCPRAPDSNAPWDTHEASDHGWHGDPV